MVRRMNVLDRSSIIPEKELPDSSALLDEARSLSKSATVGRCAFLSEFDVESESQYKTRLMASGDLMFHAQFGFRSFEKSRRAYAEIAEKISDEGYRLDRYGICLDWSMGYPAAERNSRPRGTGLVLESLENFVELTQQAPVAPHFGDFVIGTPASVENTVAALAAGSTCIGNLGQYFTFRMPHWDDDVFTAKETLKALALCASQPTEVLVHSNLDDGFAALFCDMACALGAVLIEQYIVEELIGCRVSHCYGHVYSDPVTRFAFQRALAQVTNTPGSMVYGNTTIFVSQEVENYANLASYLLVDICAQRSIPTGHALNPVPVTEALRIPDIDEIVDAHLFANRLAERSTGYESLFNLEVVDDTAGQLVKGARRFKDRVLEGLQAAEIDITDPLEMLLAVRRIGAKRLEEMFGPGQESSGVLRNRTPVVRAKTVAALEAQGDGLVGRISEGVKNAIADAELIGCVTSTDVHEYGKILVESVLDQLGVRVIDGGVCADPGVVVGLAEGADFIAVSTYSGVALEYARALREEMERIELDVPVFLGGKLNQVDDSSESGMPEDASRELQAMGIVTCSDVEEMLEALARMGKGGNSD